MQIVKSLVIALIVGVIMFFVSGWIAALVCAALLFIIFWKYVFKQKEDEQEEREAGEENSSVPDDLRDIHSEKMTADSKFTPYEIMERILRLNQQLRLSGKDASGILELFEKNIDELRDLAPKLNADKPDSDLAWRVNEVGVEFLPTLLRNYLSSSKGDEETTAANKTLQTLLDQLKEIGSTYQADKNSNLSDNATILQEIMKIRSNQENPAQ